MANPTLPFLRGIASPYLQILKTTIGDFPVNRKAQFILPSAVLLWVTLVLLLAQIRPVSATRSSVTFGMGSST